MKRLIDVADLEQFIREHRCVIGYDKFLLVAGNDGRWHEALPLIKTAYDVDKVVEQLETARDGYSTAKCMTATNAELVKRFIAKEKAMNLAIEIVKAGGKNDNNL